MAEKRRVLVTGSSRGIGKAVATELANAGFSVVLHCRSRIDEANAVAEEIEGSTGDRPAVLQFDVSERDSARDILTKYITENGSLYGVVLNAGVTRDTIFPAMSGEEWDDVIATNLGGFYNVLHPLLMPMIQLRAGGRIVVMSSGAGISGNPGQVNYSASKAGLIGATKSLAKELAKRRISVNCVAPGFIESEMTESLPNEKVVEMIPMRRFGRTDEISALVGFLFTERAEYITAQVISVNGGLV